MDKDFIDRLVTTAIVILIFTLVLSIGMTLLKWIVEFSSTTLGVIIIIVIVLRVLKNKEKE